LQQKKLFLISYEDMVLGVKRISRGTKNVACNDLKAFKKAMKNRAFWVDKQGVPEVRFNERIAWLNK